MKWFSLAIFSIFLTACQLVPRHFSLPDRVDFQGQTYVKTTAHQIDEMQHLLYLPEQSSRDPEHWQRGILFFLDKNSQGKSLAERIILRQNVFRQQDGTQFKIEQVKNELRSQVIYPPTSRFQNIQLEVSRGRDLPCGYGQIQFSDKRSISGANVQTTRAYLNQIEQLAEQFAQLPWQIGCH